MNPSWPVIVLGGSGYVAGEMLRLVLAHPQLELGATVSTSQAGEPVAATFAHLAPALGDIRFLALDAVMERLGESEHWVVLSAAPHGASAGIVAELLAAAAAVGSQLTVVDASADFRFRDPDAFAGVYGHPHPAPGLLADFTCAVPEHRDTLATPHAAHPGLFNSLQKNFWRAREY